MCLTFFFFHNNISINIMYMFQIVHVCSTCYILEGTVSQNCYLGPSFYFMKSLSAAGSISPTRLALGPYPIDVLQMI